MVQWQHAFLTSYTTPEKRYRCFFWWHTSANTIVPYQSGTMLAILFFNATLFTIVAYPRSRTRASTGLFVQRPTIVAFVQWADSCAQHVQHKTGILARSFSLCVSVLSLGPYCWRVPRHHQTIVRDSGFQVGTTSALDEFTDGHHAFLGRIGSFQTGWTIGA